MFDKKITKFKHLILAQLIYSLDKNKIGQLLSHESTNYGPTMSCGLKILILTKGKIPIKKKRTGFDPDKVQLEGHD